MNEEVKVELSLTTEERQALRALAASYLGRGDPAYECMQEWDEPHRPESLLSLRTKLLEI